MIKHILFLQSLLVLVLLVDDVKAQKQYVASNPGELKSIISNLQPGDIVSLAAGTWNDVEVVVDNDGTAKQPITIRAKAAGKTVITGNSSFKIGGAHVVIQDFIFKNVVPAYVHDDAIVAFKTGNKEGHNDLVKNCKFIQDERLNIPNDRQHGFFWIDIYGANNTVDGCTFQGKKNWLPVIDVKSKNRQQGHHVIQNNIFSDTQPKPGISLESIRVGLGENIGSFTMIRNNLFIRCNGDSEIISTKSGNNYIYNNYFVRCYASVSLRGGNGIIVKGNYFYYTLGGIRINGSDHQLVGNYFYRVQQNPVALMMGSNSKECGYSPVSNIKIDSNYFVGNAGFAVLVHYNKKCSELPKQITMNNNFLLGKEGAEKKLDEGDIMTRKNNAANAIMERKSLVGGKSNAAAANGDSQRAAELPISISEQNTNPQDAVNLRKQCDYYTKNILNSLNSRLTKAGIKAIPDKAGSEDRQLALLGRAAQSSSNIFDKIGADF
jgi:poly(beta-D-mannuronate) lyase